MGIRRRPGSQNYHYDFSVKGNRFRGSTETQNREQATIIEAKFRAEILLGQSASKKPRLALEQACARYWLDHAHRLKSAYNIRYQLKRILAGVSKATMLDALTNDQIATYVARRRGEVSDSSVNRDLTLLRAVLIMARDRWGVEVAMPNWKSHWLKEPYPSEAWLTPEQVALVHGEAAGHLKAPIRFSLLTGVRLSNCINLDWSQISMARREIVFRLKSDRPGGKPHTIPMSEPVFVLLANLGPRDAGRVFTYKGRAIKSWRRAWKRAQERAGIGHFRWHDLRHTAATWMRHEGVPVDMIQKVLGHERIETTMRYAKIDPDAKRAAVDALASRMGHSEQSATKQAIGKKRK